MTSLVVVGWYNRGNAGDQLMMEALQKLFSPRGVELEFVGRVKQEHLDRHDGLIIGGGSILYGNPEISTQAMATLLAGEKPVFYLGVGMETEVQPAHQRLLNIAKIVVTRSKAIRAETVMPSTFCYVPDLVYSLPLYAPGNRNVSAAKILVVPNVECIPTHEDPHWQHLAWERYKDEAAQYLDYAIEKMDFAIEFLTMCKNDRQDDVWAMNEIVSRMKNRSTNFRHIHAGSDTSIAVEAFNEPSVVLTQRFHGIILSEMSGCPYVNIWHHDKLGQAQPMRGASIGYYSITKALLRDAVNEELATKTREHDNTATKASYDAIVSDIIEVLSRG